jgi:hypothetical protein
MTSRREFLGYGVAAALAPVPALADGRVTCAMHAADAFARHLLHGQPLYKAIYDLRFPASIDFAAQLARSGVAVAAIDADITALWFRDLSLQWREQPVAIAGFTASEAHFCLEQLAWEHRLRTVLRTEHVDDDHGRAGRLVAWVIAPA